MNVAPSFSTNRAPNLPAAATSIPRLTDVPETMLWALYNRAAEAGRTDGVLADADSVRIHKSIDYDFQGHFGSPPAPLPYVPPQSTTCCGNG